jgi:hypothetical protein
MGFDKNDERPLVKASRRTTKVNLGIVIAVAVFVAFGVGAVVWMRHLTF